MPPSLLKTEKIAAIAVTDMGKSREPMRIGRTGIYSNHTLFRIKCCITEIQIPPCWKRNLNLEIEK